MYRKSRFTGSVASGVPLFLITLLVLGLLFAGCDTGTGGGGSSGTGGGGSGGDIVDGNGTINRQNLVGTVWRHQEADWTATLSFTGSSTVKADYLDEEGTESATGSYTVSGNTITITAQGNRATATIIDNGTKLRWVDDEETLIFTRIK